MKIPYRPSLAPPLSHTILFLLFLFLPFQERFFKWVKPLSKMAFKSESLPPYFIDRCLDYYLGEILLLGALLFFTFSLGKKCISLFWDKEHKYLTLFLMISLISLPFSSRKESLWPYLRWSALALCLFSSHLLCSQVEVKKVLSTCFFLLIFASLVESTLVFFQYQYQHELGLKHLGELHVHYGHSASIFVSSKRRWIFDWLLSLQASSSRLLRPYGTLPHPNMLGAFMGMSIFASYFFYLEQRFGFKKIVLTLIMIIQVFALCLTYSRGALFALILSTLFLILLQRKKTYSLLLPLFLGLIFSGCALGEQFLERGGVVNTTSTSKGSDLSRLQYQNRSIQIIKRNPLVGCGWSQFLTQKENFSTGTYITQKVHNIYLLLLTETGILGLSTFLLFFLSLFYFSMKAGLDLISSTLLSLLSFFLLFGLVDHFFITFHHGREMLFLTTALLSAYYREKTATTPLSLPGVFADGN